RSGAAEVLHDAEGRVLMPSAVRYLENGQVHVGYEAYAAQGDDPVNTIVSVKRFMGRGIEDARRVPTPYTFADTDGGMLRLRTVQGSVSPVEVSAQILATLRQLGEQVLADDLVGAVITVPAYFDDAQRQATRDAAHLAGLNILRLLNEPTAAAVAYGLDQESNLSTDRNYVIYDLGGGTFDVSILRFSQGVFEVLATGGHTALGGDDLDRLILKWAKKQLNIDTLNDAEYAHFVVAARKAKEALSDADSVQLKLLDQVLTLDRPTFEEIIKVALDKTISVCKRVMRDAKLELDDIQN